MDDNSPQEAPTEQTPQPRSRRRLVVGLGVILLVAGLVGGLVTWRIVAARGNRYPTGPALKRGDALLEKGDLPGAEAAYREFLEEYPKHGPARYGLGFACIHQGKRADAGTAFRRIRDPYLQFEGQAALAFDAQGADAKPVIEKAQAMAPTPYVEVLFAKADALDGRDAEAVRRLEDIRPRDLRFRWQYRDAQQTLAQAYYHLGRFDDACDTFEELEDSPVDAQRRMAQEYILDVARRRDVKPAELADAVRALREKIDGAPAHPPAGEALSFFVLPIEAETSRLAIEWGLVDLVALLLADALDRETSMALVEPRLIHAILAAPEFAEHVGQKSGQAALAKSLGARLILKCRFARLGSIEQAAVVITNVETGDETLAGPVDIARQPGLGTVVEALADAVRTAVQTAATTH